MEKYVVVVFLTLCAVAATPWHAQATALPALTIPQSLGVQLKAWNAEDSWFEIVAEEDEVEPLHGGVIETIAIDPASYMALSLTKNSTETQTPEWFIRDEELIIERKTTNP